MLVLVLGYALQCSACMHANQCTVQLYFNLCHLQRAKFDAKLLGLNRKLFVFMAAQDLFLCVRAGLM